MTSQLWSFSELLFRLPDPNSEKNPVNQLIIKSGYDKNGRKMSQPQTAD